MNPGLGDVYMNWETSHPSNETNEEFSSVIRESSGKWFLTGSAEEYSFVCTALGKSFLFTAGMQNNKPNYPAEFCRIAVPSVAQRV